MPSAAAPDAASADRLAALRVILPEHAFSDAELADLLPMSELCRYGAAHTLIAEGEPSDNRVYFLLEGSVSVSIQGRFILRLGNRGDCIGEMGLISSAPRSATVRTEGPARFLAINSALAEREPEPGDYKLRYYLSRIFNSILTEKLRATSDRARLYEDMVTHSERVEKQRRSLEGEIATYLRQISLYSHLVNSANDAILITDSVGRILNANRALTRAFGIETDTVIGVEAGILLAMPDGAPGNWAAIAAEARGEGWHGELALYHPSRGAIPVDCSVSAVHDAEQALLAYSVILRDIRERKALEAQTLRQAAELERAYGQLRELDRAKSNFAHCLRARLRRTADDRGHGGAGGTPRLRRGDSQGGREAERDGQQGARHLQDGKRPDALQLRRAGPGDARALRGGHAARPRRGPRAGAARVRAEPPAAGGLRPG
jgi:PAS domain S-box-containing protein